MLSKAKVVARDVAALVFVSLAMLCAPVLAQQADQPGVKDGDQWSFVVFPSAAPNRVWVVKSVMATGIHATENGEPLTLTLDLNVVDSPLLTQTNPLMLRFPMRVGDRWTFATDVRFKDNGSTARAVFEVAVIAHEKVRVAAGEFDAFKLVAKSRFTGSSKGGPGKLEGESMHTYWYAPTARAIVKSLSQSPYRGKSTVELAAFELRPL